MLLLLLCQFNGCNISNKKISEGRFRESTWNRAETISHFKFCVSAACSLVVLSSNRKLQLHDFQPL